MKKIIQSLLFRVPLTLLAGSLLLVSCSDDSEKQPEPVESASVYVTNEGNFSDSNGSLTSYQPDDGTTLQNAFEEANGRPLAGIVQSSRITDGRMYIVLNMANKIEVVDAHTLESLGTIELSEPPSAIEVIDGETAYVTTLNNVDVVDSVHVVDLSNMTETNRRIPVGNQPRDIVQVGDKVFIANSGGGNGHTLTMYQMQKDVTESVEVGHGPTQIVADSEKRLWVVCSGRVAYDDNWQRDPENDIPGSVYILDGSSGTVIDSVETGGHPSSIALNEDRAQAYLLNEGVSTIDMNTFDLQEDFIPRSFSAIGYFPLQQRLYLGDSRGYSQEGQALIYNLEGTAVDSFAAGIAPSGFGFYSN